MINIELNIGLHVQCEDAVEQLYANEWREVLRRGREAEAILHQQATDVYVRFSPNDEPTLVVRAVVESDRHAFDLAYGLATRLDQDCVALYLPDERRGYLIGPRAEQWGSFQLRYFTRY